MTDDEKTVIHILKANSPIDLNEIKGLIKNKLTKVEKTDEGLLVSLV
jgi:hypothetical protein